jgi:hypothetical protein
MPSRVAPAPSASARARADLDEVEVVFDRGEVGAREVDLAQGEWLIVWHAHVCARMWLLDR